MPLDLTTLARIIADADFDRLVGEVENEWFDCKSQPYQLDAGDYAKRELAKDVTAFANAGGGYILIGFRTEPGAARFGEDAGDGRHHSPQPVKLLR